MTSDGIGDRFQRETRYTRNGPQPGKAFLAERPEPFKAYPHARRVELPEPARGDTLPLIEAIQQRGSVRRFAADPLPLRDLSFLLWCSGGVREVSRGFAFRTVPSAGGLYPIETYVVANDIAGLDRGVWHYNILAHSLELVREGDLREKAASAALGQGMAGEAPALFVWTAVLGRTLQKYGQRGYRYVYLDAGHVAGNLCLAAVSIGLGSCQIGALYDDESNDLVGVDGERESVVFMSAVGRPA